MKIIINCDLVICVLLWFVLVIYICFVFLLVYCSVYIVIVFGFMIFFYWKIKISFGFMIIYCYNDNDWDCESLNESFVCWYLIIERNYKIWF